ncbi:MAG: hypothetical protein ONB48_12735 [candidate division KSB1 bacterium]|nr:hypothetical protein [candidate division KSB1 bacterium]MDZ7275039.1 hypothetical protein [candidate division KSB1 bacterium]MDZ7286512.1 hypothetical protein [candidate division KSB1 bacterium]MDZ7299324.1 hypothetical protein [candidate division KSB1 bacterium]MDZ7306995.1 hypothetical protein [candidate division KSB1 bacterium]
MKKATAFRFLLAGLAWLALPAAEAQEAEILTLHLAYTSNTIGYVDPCG